MVDKVTVIIVPSALRPQLTIDGMSTALKSGKCPGACTQARASLKASRVTASDSCCCCTFFSDVIILRRWLYCNMQIQEVFQVQITISILTGGVTIFKVVAFLAEIRLRLTVLLHYHH